MPAILLSIGDELILGQTVDTNAAWLAGRLSGLGIGCVEHRTVPDDLDHIAEVIQQCAEAAKVLIITGGLGPTDDDLTRPALAKAMGVDLTEDPASVEHIASYFKGRGRVMPERNRIQATHPQTSTMIENTCGTAPGIRATLGHCEVFVTPGVPREMKAMFEHEIEPAIQDRAGTARTILTAKLNSFGSGESDIADRLGPLMARDRNPLVGTTVANGYVSVRVRSEHEDPRQAKALLEEALAQAKDKVGPLAFGQNEVALQDVVIALLTEQGKTIAVAESCTGGLISGMLTDVPGSSASVLGGWVTYANEMKAEQLGVPMALIEQHGAVSQQVVEAMASGALEQSGADFALSTSGIAGPGGGSKDKPVGTVWIGMAYREGEAVKAIARLAILPGDREAVRDRSAKCALQLLRLQLMGEDLNQMKWASAP
ncbi:MAG: competence/damage-inducible protein A [Phycisphaeraceae bacterium]|nr:competence/damage-inducible protein A [Phycisphaeraceae bacterium]